MYCKKCGRELAGDEQFCPACGTAVEPINPVNEEEIAGQTEKQAKSEGIAVEPEELAVSSEESSTQETPLAAEFSEEETTKPAEASSTPEISPADGVSEEETPKLAEEQGSQGKKNRRVLLGVLIFFGALLIVLIIAVSILIVALKDTPQTDLADGDGADVASVAEDISVVPYDYQVNTASTMDPTAECNFNDWGYFAYDDEKLYYLEYNDEGSGWGLKLDSYDYHGENRTLVLDNNDLLKFRIVGEDILFLEATDETLTYGLVAKDGSNQRTILQLDNNDYDYDKFNIIDDQFYYVYNDALYCCTLTGENNHLVLDDVYTFTSDGEQIYYAADSNGKIFVYQPAENVVAEVYDTENYVLTMVYDQGSLYYYDGYSVNELSLTEPSVPQKISLEEECISFNITEDAIYYVQKLPEMEAAGYLDGLMEWDDIFDYYVLEEAVDYLGTVWKVSKNGGTPVQVSEDYVSKLYCSPAGLYYYDTVFGQVFPLEMLE